MAYFAKIEKQTDPFDNSNEDYWVVTNVVAISNDTPLSVGLLGCLLYTSDAADE